MLSWLASFVSAASSLIPSPIRDFVHWAIHGIAGVVDTVFHEVTSAWDTFRHSTAEFADGLAHFAAAVTHQLTRIITYYIPHYAIYAWWWITHPEQLAKRLFWHLINVLEANAWKAAERLSVFALQLVRRNVRHLVALAEDIFTAVF
jgi:hypothetical protein